MQRAQRGVASRFLSQLRSSTCLDGHVTDSDQPARIEFGLIADSPDATLRGDLETKSEFPVKTLSAFVCFRLLLVAIHHRLT
jgi:hypothetical protein